MRRRDFIALAAGVAAWPCRVKAREPDKRYRIALTSAATPLGGISATGAPIFRTLFEELRRAGYIEGQNLIVDRQSGYDRSDDYATLVGDVVALAPDVIFTNTNALTRHFKNATSIIPIVTIVSDPVADGFVTSLSRPDANVTGVSIDAGLEIWPKRVQLMKELLPGMSRLGFLNPHTSWDYYSERILDAIGRADLSLLGPALNDPITASEYTRVFRGMGESGAEALMVSMAPQNSVHGKLIVALAEKYRLPAIYPYNHHVHVGGLMGYTVDTVALFKQAATQIAALLKGEQVRNIPFYQPTKFELLLNLKTAKSLGLEFPPALLARADEVIE